MVVKLNSNKLLFGGLCGLAGGVFFLWLIVEGLGRNEAMTFSRHLAWFNQRDNPADYVASVLLHASLSIAAIASSVGAIGRYFYFLYPPDRFVLSIFVGFLAAVAILFFAQYSLFAIVGYPLVMLLGFPIAVIFEYLWPSALGGGFLPAPGSSQLVVALAYISGFMAWWLLTALLVWRRLCRMECE